MNRPDTIAEAVLSTKQIAARYFAGFDDSNRTKQAPTLPNHFAWNLGHAAQTMHRAAEKISGGYVISHNDFIIGGTPSGGGDKTRFAIASVAAGSKPVDDPAQYPSFSRCIDIYNHACDTVADIVRHVPDEELDELVEWGPMKMPRWLLALRMMTHNGMHIGQIADLRRAFGFKSINS